MARTTPLEDQIRECFGRVVYTHKTHEKMADGCTAMLRRLKLTQLFLTGLSSTSAISVLFVDKGILKILTAVLSLASFWASGYVKNFDPGSSAQKHRDTAAGLWPIRESYLSLLTDIRGKTITDEEAIARRDTLQAKLASLYKGAPQTNSKAYSKAQKALKMDEEYTFSDEEIDVFLPASLRKGLDESN